MHASGVRNRANLKPNFRELFAQRVYIVLDIAESLEGGSLTAVDIVLKQRLVDVHGTRYLSSV